MKFLYSSPLGEIWFRDRLLLHRHTWNIQRQQCIKTVKKSNTEERKSVVTGCCLLGKYILYLILSELPVSCSSASGRLWAWAPCSRSSDSRRSRGVAGLISQSACSALHLCNLIHATHQSSTDPHPALVTPPHAQEEHGGLVSDVTWHQGIGRRNWDERPLTRTNHKS